MNNSVISIRNLTKNYGSLRAVDNISFDVPEGQFFAFLGANGAGKSTTINILSTILKKDGGTVKVFGCDIDRDAALIRGQMGIVFQNSVLDKSLSVKDNLSVRAGLYGIRGDELRDRLKSLSAYLSLDELYPRAYAKLSGGERRRVDVARAMINVPRLLIMDEPTTGLDPYSRKNVWEIIGRMREEMGITIFLTTHYMDETLGADNVIILDGGKIAAEGSPIELKNRYSNDYIYIYADKSVFWDNVLDGRNAAYEDNRYKARIKDSADAVDFIRKHGDMLQSFEVAKGDMDDVFLNVTGKKIVGGVK